MNVADNDIAPRTHRTLHLSSNTITLAILLIFSVLLASFSPAIAVSPELTYDLNLDLVLNERKLHDLFFTLSVSTLLDVIKSIRGSKYLQ